MTPPPAHVTLLTSGPIAYPPGGDCAEPQFRVSVLGDGALLLEVFPMPAQEAYTFRAGLKAAFELVGSLVTEAEGA